MSDTIEPNEKDQSSRRRSSGKHHFRVKGGKIPVWTQLVIIVVTFAVLLTIVTLVFNHLDQPISTKPTPYGPGE